MKKFKFSLQTVHNLRETKREQEQLKLAERQAALVKAEENLLEIERARHNALENYVSKIQAGEMPSFEISLMMDYLKSLAGRADQARAVVAQAKQSFRQQGEMLAFAAREVETTAKLRERQQARYNLELARAEQTALDEMVSINFARQAIQAQ